jgi:hypothetical protein
MATATASTRRASPPHAGPPGARSRPADPRSGSLVALVVSSSGRARSSSAGRRGARRWPSPAHRSSGTRRSAGPFANDLNLPHVWNILLTFNEPWQRGADRSVAQFLVDAALYTWREAFIGFVLGAAIGLVLATVFVHSRLLERALVPYVVASQTIPIIALAPLIVFAFGANVAAVVVIATYLTFFR